EFEIRKVSPVPVPEGGRDERRDTLLQHFADARDGELLPRDVIWPEVARYAVGRYADVSEHGIRAACEFIAARSDCADFTIQGVLRILAWESAERRLPAELNELMKETVLGFKYWVDEPGDTVMFMGSENHRLAFHVAEWLAGTLFPLEEFSNSRQRGLFHAAKGRAYIVEWLRQRGRFGFDEWHSNAYFPVCLGPLANVYDFAIDEEYKLKQMTASVLDYMAFILAADTYRGIFGTTHGRSYTRYIKHPGMESTSAACWLWYGEGTLVRQTRGVMAPVTLGSGDYWPPPILHEIAADTSSVVESKQRQGLMRSGEQSANFSVFRTPDFLMSGLQDHRKGEYDSAIHAAQVTLPNEAVVFWSCPQTTGEGSGLRPDYWSGNTTLPRVIHYRNVMSLTWQPSTYAWMTHCFFERSRFDEIRERGNWVFGRSSDGYIGIYSQHGMSWGRDGQYAGRELICTTLPNTWIVECGRREDWGSFDGFVDALQDAPIETAGDVLTYRSPSLGEFRTGWSVEPSIDGGVIELRDYPMVESPWASAAFGSGELTVRYGESVEHLWFNQ
ncbi:hypothetical protein, partial [Pseudactinotalea sp.]|uniref:hypothetical protein n=1 Tax=Pseudactinotalea sp. TaxID=1926260 RepID=UPI003B3A933B